MCFVFSLPVSVPKKHFCSYFEHNYTNGLNLLWRKLHVCMPPGMKNLLEKMCFHITLSGHQFHVNYNKRLMCSLIQSADPDWA